MLKREHMPHVFGAATLALMFSAVSVYPQTTTGASGTTGSGAGRSRRRNLSKREMAFASRPIADTKNYLKAQPGSSLAFKTMPDVNFLKIILSSDAHVAVAASCYLNGFLDGQGQIALCGERPI